MIVTNSNVKHELEGSEYAGRRDQCYRAASICKKDSLREVTADLLNGFKIPLQTYQLPHLYSFYRI